MTSFKCPQCQKHSPADRENCVHCGHKIFAKLCPECEVIKSKNIIGHRQAIDEINRRLTNIKISEYDARILKHERERLKKELQFLTDAPASLYPENVLKCPRCGTVLKKIR